jgi:hypothetical protein
MMIKFVWKKAVKPVAKFFLKMVCWTGCSWSILQVYENTQITLLGEIVFSLLVAGAVIVTDKLWSLGENKDVDQKSMPSQLWDATFGKLWIPDKPLIYCLVILVLSQMFIAI